MTVWAPSLSTRAGQLRPTAVNTVLAEVRQLQEGGRSPVSLMRGEPDLATPGHIAEAAVKAIGAGRTSYPNNRGETGLRDAAAQKLARDNGLTYDAGREILVTTGATLGIHAALNALLDDGDEVLLPDPIYDAYQSAVLLAGGRCRPVPSAIEDGRFTVPIDGLESAVSSSAKVLLLNTPWNPVGTVLGEAELRAIGDFAIRHDLTLISDEIYETIVYDGHQHVSPASLSNDLRERTVLVNSLSKTYAMTGMARRLLRGASADHQRDVPRVAAIESWTSHFRTGRRRRGAVGLAGGRRGNGGTCTRLAEPPSPKRWRACHTSTRSCRRADFSRWLTSARPDSRLTRCAGGCSTTRALSSCTARPTARVAKALCVSRLPAGATRLPTAWIGCARGSPRCDRRLRRARPRARGTDRRRRSASTSCRAPCIRPTRASIRSSRSGWSPRARATTSSASSASARSSAAH